MYLLGTFLGAKGSITISDSTKKEDVEKFLKANPTAVKRITSKERIEAQKALIPVKKVVDKKA